MLGEATLDVSGTFAGEAIRVLILFAAQHRPLGSQCRLQRSNVVGQRFGRPHKPDYPILPWVWPALNHRVSQSVAALSQPLLDARCEWGSANRSRQAYRPVALH